MSFKHILVGGLLTILLAACNGAPSASTGDAARPAPDFSLPNALGGEAALQDYAGQPVLLFFHMAVG